MIWMYLVRVVMTLVSIVALLIIKGNGVGLGLFQVCWEIYYILVLYSLSEKFKEEQQTSLENGEKNNRNATVWTVER